MKRKRWHDLMFWVAVLFAVSSAVDFIGWMRGTPGAWHELSADSMIAVLAFWLAAERHAGGQLRDAVTDLLAKLRDLGVLR